MRRGLAILLLAITGLIPATPLLAAYAQASLPGCCRRTGKHHCKDKEQAADRSQEPGISTVPMRCPMYPTGVMGSGYSLQLLPAAAPSFYAALSSRAVVIPQVEASYRICFSRSQQKRGPPTFVS
jgi:hypothetical protein